MFASFVLAVLPSFLWFPTFASHDASVHRCVHHTQARQESNTTKVHRTVSCPLHPWTVPPTGLHIPTLLCRASGGSVGFLLVLLGLCAVSEQGELRAVLQLQLLLAVSSDFLQDTPYLAQGPLHYGLFFICSRSADALRLVSPPGNNKSLCFSQKEGNIYRRLPLGLPRFL